MLDCGAVILMVLVVVVIATVYFRLRLLTALAVGALIGTILSGALVRMAGDEGDFESTALTERQHLYSIFAFFAIILILASLLVGAFREARRKRLSPARM